MSYEVELSDLTVSFGDAEALSAVSARIGAGSITGLLGRNGAGKTTLASVIASHIPPSSGTVRIDGQEPWENPRLMAGTALVPAARTADNGCSVADVLGIAEALRPSFDRQRAEELLERFGIATSGAVDELSTGMRSALSVSVGIAARAAVTIFDETHQGMDAAARSLFYEELLADYTSQPRTIVMSSHLIDEIAPLLENVLVLHEGRLLADASVEDLRSAGAELIGPADAVAAAADGLEVLSQRRLGNTVAVVVLGEIGHEANERARRSGVEISALPLQQLFIHMTGKEAQRT